MVRLNKKIKASTLLETIIAFVVLGFIVFSTGYLFYQVNRSAPANTLTKIHLKLVSELYKETPNNAGESTGNFMGYTIKHTVTSLPNGVLLNEISAFKQDKLIDRVSRYQKGNEQKENHSSL